MDKLKIWLDKRFLITDKARLSKKLAAHTGEDFDSIYDSIFSSLKATPTDLNGPVPCSICSRAVNPDAPDLVHVQGCNTAHRACAEVTGIEINP